MSLTIDQEEVLRFLEKNKQHGSYSAQRGNFRV